MPTLHETTLIHRSFWRGQRIEVEQNNLYRMLHFGTSLKQSSMLRSEPHKLVLSYSHYMVAGLLYLPNPQAILIIGLGGGSLAKFFRHYYPQCQVDIVELSDRVVDVAHLFFELKRDPKLTIHIEDGCHFVQKQRPSPRYDWIFVDAFDAHGMAESVYSDAFFLACRQLLHPMGLLSINLLRPFASDNTYHNIVTTLQSLFPHNLTKLSVPQTTNDIYLAFPSPLAAQRLPTPQTATRLQNKLAIPFSSLATMTSTITPSLWQKIKLF